MSRYGVRRAPDEPKGVRCLDPLIMSAENSGAQEASSSRHLRARGNWSRRAIGALLVSATVSCNQRAAPSGASGDLEWGTVSGELTGTRYSPAPIISRANVKHLRRVWVQRTGDWPIRVGEQFPADRTPTRASAAALPSYRFETTAVMHHRMLFVATPFNRVIALDPSSGAIRWTFDPRIARSESNPEGFVARGVAVWDDSLVTKTSPCATRVFVTTLDARLIALDGVSGLRCEGFGRNGEVDLTYGAGILGADAARVNLAVTSPPAIVQDLVIVGSAVRETLGIGAASGVVRAYDARRGTVRWSFDPIPRGPAAKSWRHWHADDAKDVIGGNVWSLATVDTERALVFLPTASAAPDFFGGNRSGRNDYANSVVALRASTGEVAWSFQVVHHDLWDYDVAAQPILAELSRDAGRVPVVIVGTKSGMIFVLNRETGVPVIAVEERPVPSSDVLGEAAWPTQPFPVYPPPLLGVGLSPDSMFGVTDEERSFCRAAAAALRNDGIFTPPSTRGTLQWPGPWGGINWDGLAWDQERQRLVIALKRVAMAVRLHQRSESTERYAPSGIGEELSQVGSPYVATRVPLIAPSGTPCSPPPWSLLMAIDFGARDARVAWQRPLGTVPWLSQYPQHRAWGSLSFGGPLVTAGGVVFIAASQDGKFRALDVDSGAQLWEHQLPAGGQASPMTYVLDGKQYVVVAAGGRSGIGAPGDWIVAFALQE
jgi:quinoprotein glucose dehydrogenase